MFAISADTSDGLRNLAFEKKVTSGDGMPISNSGKELSPLKSFKTNQMVVNGILGNPCQQCKLKATRKKTRKKTPTLDLIQ